MSIQLRTYTHKELCDLYKVTGKTLTEWLKPFIKKTPDTKRKRLYTIAEVELIFSRLGVPFDEEKAA